MPHFIRWDAEGVSPSKYRWSPGRLVAITASLLPATKKGEWFQSLLVYGSVCRHLLPMTERSTLWTWDVLTHTIAGLVALVAGALMFSYPPALWLFSGLMLVSAVSALLISWQHGAWVTGHWLAMLPVLGVVWGVWVDSSGFTFAYLLLWLAFGHFIYRGIQASRGSR